jgi:hypothetical protein
VSRAGASDGRGCGFSGYFASGKGKGKGEGRWMRGRACRCGESGHGREDGRRRLKMWRRVCRRVFLTWLAVKLRRVVLCGRSVLLCAGGLVSGWSNRRMVLYCNTVGVTLRCGRAISRWASPTAAEPVTFNPL